MVTIEKKDGNFIFEIMGLHKLWSLKGHLSIPAAHIIKAYKNTHEASGFLGLRLPGTHLPGIITAGTYRTTSNTIFCDFTDTEKVIVIDLKDETFTRLLIEVEDVEKSIDLLMAK